MPLSPLSTVIWALFSLSADANYSDLEQCPQIPKSKFQSYNKHQITGYQKVLEKKNKNNQSIDEEH